MRGHGSSSHWFGRLVAVAIAATSCALAGAASDAAQAAAGGRVRTAYGWVEGTMGSDAVSVFRGIPYAAPPLGPLRWRAPLPPPSWDGVRSAAVFFPDCPQHSPEPAPTGKPARPQSENCLGLNIWTPEARAGANRPVMVWIHGGGYQFGSGAVEQYDGAHFARSGVVLVTLNYRVGALGFLAHPELTAEATHHSSGNYGLLDQIAALHWVRQNIAAFGGDPNRVTIFGESAGSGAVNILQASPLAKGLFARVIGESTSQMDPSLGLTGRLSRQQAEAAGQGFAASLGARNLEDMRKLPAEALLGAPFWPLDPDGYVLPQSVYDTFLHGDQNDVPTLVGANAAEGENLHVPWIKPETAQEKSAIRHLYPRGLDDPQLYSDDVAWQMQIWSALQALHGQQPSYLYLFKHRHAGALPIHGAEIVYVFRNFDGEPQQWSEADRRIGERLAAYWINFARSGDPNGPGLVPWPVFHPQAPQLMQFDDEAAAAPAPRQDAYQFMENYYGRRRTSDTPGADFGNPGGKARVNIDLSGNDAATAASVPGVALDPRDERHIAIVWRTISLNAVDGRAPDQGAHRDWVCHLSTSTDAGLHFSDQAIDWNLPDTSRCNAPFVDFAADGTLYVGASLTAESGGDLGRAVVRSSGDGGHTWSATHDAIGTDTQERFAPDLPVPIDSRMKPWDGARGVVARDTGRLFVTGGYPAPPGGKEHSERFYTSSTDGGATWGPIFAFGSKEWPQRWDSHVVAAHGELAITYIADAVPVPDHPCPCVVFARTSGGGAGLSRSVVASVRQLDTLVHYPTLAAHPSQDNTYVIGLVSEDGAQIQLLTSTDGGTHWFATQVREPANVSKVSRPAVTLSPDGVVVVMWRGYHPDQSYDVYMAAGMDAAHLNEPLRLSEQSSSVPPGLMTNYAARGDFLNALAADSKFAHAAWTDWRTGSQARVYYGRVPLPQLLHPR